MIKNSKSSRFLSLFLAILMLFSCLPMSVFAADDDITTFKVDSTATAELYNQVGDMAIKGTSDRTYASITWTSIPGYQASSAQIFALVDADGNSHDAYCIDAGKASGVGDNAKFIATFTGPGARALYAIKDVSARSFDVTLNPVQYTDWDGTIKETEKEIVPVKLKRDDVIMALRWYAWINNVDSEGNGNPEYKDIRPALNVNQWCTNAWNDFYNLAVASGDVIPELYLYECTTNVTRIIDYEHRKDVPLETAKALGLPTSGTARYLTSVPQNGEFETTLPQTRYGNDGNRYHVWYSEKWSTTPVNINNYETVLAGNDLKVARESYLAMVNSVVVQMYSEVITKITDEVYVNYGDVVGYVWACHDNHQRFVTFDYIPQSPPELKLTKNSAIPAVSNNNGMYSLKGIKYEIIANGQSLGESLVLDANGVSNTVTLKPSDNIHVGDTIYLREVDDPVRKASGYALDTTTHAVTLHRGLNEITVSDVPLNDPPSLQLQKVDKETRESNDKQGM